MDFLTFVDNFFEKDQTKRGIQENKFVLLYWNEIVIKFPEYYYRLELEKDNNNSFRLDIPYKDSVSGEQNYLRFYGSYDYIKSILVDFVEMDDISYKLSYGKNKPKLPCVDFNFCEDVNEDNI